MPKKQILIIDDDSDIRESTKTILEANKYNVITAESTADALEVLKKNKPDLIICDMMMEEIDSGLNAAKDIKNKYPKIPIFLFSNVGDSTAQTMNISEMGFSGVFQKPTPPDILIETIESALK